MIPDWKVLAPHKPLDPGAAAYVTPPEGGGQAIAAWVKAGGTTVLVGGPTGVGKSTELARAARLLQDSRVACLVPLDRWENMRALDANKLRLRIAGRVAEIALEVLRLPVSDSLKNGLILAGALEQSAPLLPPEHFQASAASLLNQTLLEVARVSHQGRVSLLIDGLEKVPEGPGSSELFEALAMIPQSVDLVTVIPWHAAFGPRADVVIRAGEHLENLRAVEVEGSEGAPGREFLYNIFVQREGDIPPAALVPIITDAAVASGGLPRTFLQLLADAGTYARLKRNADWPGPEDFADALADRADSFRRLLLPGDEAAIQRVAGTDGRELDLERKLRLMANGIILERLRNGRPVLHIHPLAQRAIGAAFA